MVNALEDQGIVVEASHHEVAVGQHEIDQVRPGPADRRQRRDVWVTLKAIAQRHGLYATPMPAVLRHQRLGDALPPEPGRRPDGENLFYDQSDEYGLSDLAGTSSPASSRTRGGCARSLRRS